MTFIFSLSAILVGIFFIIFSVYGYYQFTGLIVPGVRLGEQKLGGMNLSQAALTLHRAWDSGMEITVSNGAQSQEIKPSELGYEFDAIRTAQKAVDIGRGGSILAEMAMMFASLKDGWQITPQVSFNEQICRQALGKLAPMMSKPPLNASFQLDGENLVTVPSQVGYTIDIDATINQLTVNPQEVLTMGKLEVVPKFIPPDVSDATPALIEGKRLIDTPASLYAYDPITNEKFAWTVARERLVNWLDLSSSSGGIVITLDSNKVGAFLTEKNSELDQGRYLNATLYAGQAAEQIRQGSNHPIPVSHEAGVYTIRQGDTLLKIAWKLGFPYWVILNANPSLDPDQLIAGTQLAIPSKDILLPLPMVANKRIIININDQKLTVYQNDAQLKKFVISTGIDRSPTQPGIFQVQTHEKNAYASVWDLYMPNFLGIYEAWPGFMNGIHGLPTLSGGRRLWANILGKPASYGCIILDLDNAEWLYNWAENGVIVEIQP